MEYIIRAALAEESNEGWVWMARPSRTLVRIDHAARKASVYCQVRDLRDPNFIKRYNQSPRVDITSIENTIVMAQWYRDALGIRGTTARNNVDRTADLVISELAPWGWGALRAACSQPDLYVRLATRLGVLGAWLGVFGLMDPIAKLCFADENARLLLVLAAALATAIAGIAVCLGPRRPYDRSGNV